MSVAEVATKHATTLLPLEQALLDKMSAREYIAPQGISAIMKSIYLSESESLDTLFGLFDSNNAFKTVANLLKIDKNDLQRLREGFAMLEKSIDQYHFREDGSGSKRLLENYERYELENLGAIENCLKEELPSFAVSVERKITMKKITMKEKNVSIGVSIGDHSKNKKIFEEVYSILVKLYGFVTWNFAPSLIDTVNAHNTELLEMCNLISELPGETPKRGKYAFTNNEELIQARKRRDIWMEKYPTMVMNCLKKIQHRKGTKKRSYKW